MFEKIVIVTRKTRLQELVERFNSKSQAKFYIEQSGGQFAPYEQEDGEYRKSLEQLQRSLDFELKVQVMDREFLPTFLFTSNDLIVTLGQDGLVANVAKYVNGQPIIAVNPNPAIFDGVLLPHSPEGARRAVALALQGRAAIREVTMAEASLNDGQRLLAFNDLFIGPRTHVSALYRIQWGKQQEQQSSSGVLISTGAGSTGWLSSIFNMTCGVAALTGGRSGETIRLSWEDPRLVFVVREPFVSRHSQARIVAGLIESNQELALESLMPAGGVIFSDGIESDFVNFNAGTTARIKVTSQKARLVMGRAA